MPVSNVIVNEGCSGGIPYPPEIVERLLDGCIDEPEPRRQGDLGPERPQRPIGVEQGLATSRWRLGCLEQGLQSCVHPGHAHKNSATPPFAQHPQSHAAGLFGRRLDPVGQEGLQV